MSKIRKTLNHLAKADMLFWLMPPLMLLLVIGTLAQRSMGLWPAIDKYFGSFIIWAGPIPFPGAYTLLGLLSLNLTLKFLFKSEWSRQKSGIILSHLGAIILLLGGLITAITARESYMLIPEGQETEYIYSYTDRSFLIYNDQNELLNLPYQNIQNWDTSTLPFKIEHRFHCDHADILKRKAPPNFDQNKTYQSMAKFMAFKCKPKTAQPETDLTGFEFEITGTDQDGIYLAFDGMPNPIEITANGKPYTLIFGKDQTKLPFAIALKDFVKDSYGGTDMARAYHSDIIIKDENSNWPTRIEMNKPLRYRGYTFFQSSFEETPETQATILAVVQNKGWIFPYIGTLFIGIGLLVHFLIAINARKTA